MTKKEHLLKVLPKIEYDLPLKDLNLILEAMQAHTDEQLILSGVGSSTFKVAISDSHCTYDFEMKLPKTTCIRDISKRLYGSFGLKEDNGRLRE